MFSSSQLNPRHHDDLVIEDLSAVTAVSARICICICWIESARTGTSAAASRLDLAHVA